jgi:hypothetical protein
VLDTAPTGHTLLLLDASEAYQRELERQARSTQPEEVLKLLERLRDPEFTRILLVTLPEATPVHEAAALQEDLRRARIEPFAWVINQSLLNSGSCDPLLQRREASEHRYLREVVEKQAKRTAWLPWQPRNPSGNPNDEVINPYEQRLPPSCLAARLGREGLAVEPDVFLPCPFVEAHVGITGDVLEGRTAAGCLHARCRSRR